MGKVKNRNGSELEYLRGLVKELKAENKNLRKRLRELEKHEHMFERPLPEIEEDTEQTPLINCQSCGKGVMIELEIVGKIYATCNVCGDRKKLK